MASTTPTKPTYFYAAEYINPAQYGNPPPPLPLKGFEKQYPGLVLRPSSNAINNPMKLVVKIGLFVYTLHENGMITEGSTVVHNAAGIRLLIYPELADAYEKSRSYGGIRRNRKSTRNRKSNRVRKSTRNRRSTRARKSTRR